MRLGFVSTRFAGTDGVSLEARKWARVLEGMGHEVFWFSGLSDRSEEKAMCVPEAFFGHPENQWLAKRMWGCTQRDPIVTERIQNVSGYLKGDVAPLRGPLSDRYSGAGEHTHHSGALAAGGGDHGVSRGDEYEGGGASS